MFEEAVKNDFTMEMTDINEDSIVFMIHENTTENNLTLIYANRYLVYTCDNPPEDADAYFYVDCIEEQKESLGYEFYIQEIPDMEAIVGEELYYNILFLGENVTFTDHTDLFDINSETGEFEFVPGEDDIGNYTIWIKAIDIFETEKYIDFRLSVVGNVGENE